MLQVLEVRFVFQKWTLFKKKKNWKSSHLFFCNLICAIGGTINCILGVSTLEYLEKCLGKDKVGRGGGSGCATDI